MVLLHFSKQPYGKFIIGCFVRYRIMPTLKESSYALNAAIVKPRCIGYTINRMLWVQLLSDRPLPGNMVSYIKALVPYLFCSGF